MRQADQMVCLPFFFGGRAGCIGTPNIVPLVLMFVFSVVYKSNLEGNFLFYIDSIDNQ